MSLKEQRDQKPAIFKGRNDQYGDFGRHQEKEEESQLTKEVLNQNNKKIPRKYIVAQFCSATLFRATLCSLYQHAPQSSPLMKSSSVRMCIEDNFLLHVYAFECEIPTMLGRNGMILTLNHTLKVIERSNLLRSYC